MIYVRNDDAEYQSWLERHPDAYVLNIGAGGRDRAMLHHSRCGHLFPVTPGMIHTTDRPKVCSRLRFELEAWAKTERLTLELCPDCKLTAAG